MLTATGQIYSNMACRVHGQKDPHHLPEQRCPLEQWGQRRGTSHRGLRSTKVCTWWHDKGDQTFSTSSFFLIIHLLHFALMILLLCRCLSLSLSLSHTHTHIGQSSIQIATPKEGVVDDFLPDTEKSSHNYTIIFGVPLSDHHLIVILPL